MVFPLPDESFSGKKGMLTVTLEKNTKHKNQKTKNDIFNGLWRILVGIMNLGFATGSGNFSQSHLLTGFIGM